MQRRRLSSIAPTVWLRIVVPLVVAAVLILFPFDWLADVWPGYRQTFDQVFATPLAHHIGHGTIFCIGGLLALFAFPTLQSRPLLYFVVLMGSALGEEAIQNLSRHGRLDLSDWRALISDLSGTALAYGIMFGWHKISSLHRQGQTDLPEQLPSGR